MTRAAFASWVCLPSSDPGPEGAWAESRSGPPTSAHLEALEARLRKGLAAQYRARNKGVVVSHLRARAHFSSENEPLAEAAE